jgi:hypothetical protein
LCGKSEQVGHVTAGGEIQNSVRIVERLLRMGQLQNEGNGNILMDVTEKLRHLWIMSSDSHHYFQ